MIRHKKRGVDFGEGVVTGEHMTRLMPCLNEAEGVGSKPLSVPENGDRIQLCTLPAPRRAASSGLSGLAPMRVARLIDHVENLRLSTSSFTPRIVRFCCIYLIVLRPAACAAHVPWRGDFPQSLALSTVLPLPPGSGGVAFHLNASLQDDSRKSEGHDANEGEDDSSRTPPTPPIRATKQT